MRDFKPLLEVEGRTFLERAVAAFTAVGIDDVVVVTGYRGDDIAAVAARTGARVAPNPRYEEGMYSSVRAGVAALEPGVSRFFLLPADVPLVRPETVGRLAREGGAAPGGAADVAYPLVRGATGHPPLLAASLRAEIISGHPPGGLRELLLAHAARTVLVPVDDEGVLLDADTADDLARLRERAAGEGLPDEARCLDLLAEYGASDDRLAHSRTVAAAAAALAVRLNDHGQHLCLPLVVAGALLHDVARQEPRHADAGADVLEGLGYSRAAVVVRAHMRLGERAAAEPDEAQVVYLADKLVQGDRVAGLDERFGVRLERHAGDDAALAGVQARKAEAERVLRRVEEILGRPVADVLPRPG
jgi:CTP:molybdopterin cytidylyltransferase MocA